MKRFLILLFILPLLVFGQSSYTPTKPQLTRAYVRAIADFINAANQKNKTNFDTLFFGKRANGLPDDFPNIELPKTIEKTQIILIAPEVATVKQKKRKSRIYINMAGWVDKENAEFVFFVFSNGFEHQYDYTIGYKYNGKRKVFELKKLVYKGPPFDK